MFLETLKPPLSAQGLLKHQHQELKQYAATKEANGAYTLITL